MPSDARRDATHAAQARRGVRSRRLWLVGILVGLLLLGAAASAIHVVLGGNGTTSTQAISTPTPVPSPAATVPPISYTSPLTARATGWLVSATAFFRSDGYHLTSGILVPAPVSQLTSFDVSVRMRQLKGAATAACGLAFAITSNQNYDEFVVTASGTWAIYHISGRSRTTLAKPAQSVAITRGVRATNVLEVQSSNGQMTFLINGQMVDQVSNGSFASGRVGLVGAPSAEVVFSSFALSGAP